MTWCLKWSSCNSMQASWWFNREERIWNCRQLHQLNFWHFMIWWVSKSSLMMWTSSVLMHSLKKSHDRKKILRYSINCYLMMMITTFCLIHLSSSQSHFQQLLSLNLLLSDRLCLRRRDWWEEKSNACICLSDDYLRYLHD